jgi:hypothetical protein
MLESSKIGGERIARLRCAPTGFIASARRQHNALRQRPSPSARAYLNSLEQVPVGEDQAVRGAGEENRFPSRHAESASIIIKACGMSASSYDLRGNRASRNAASSERDSGSMASAVPQMAKQAGIASDLIPLQRVLTSTGVTPRVDTTRARGRPRLQSREPCCGPVRAPSLRDSRQSFANGRRRQSGIAHGRLRSPIPGAKAVP